MALPKKLKNFMLYNEGNSYLGEVKEIKLPTLGRKFEEYIAAGMSGPIKVDLSAVGMEIEHKYGGFMQDLVEQMGEGKVDGVLLTFAGSYQRDDSADTTAVEIMMRGRHEEIDSGSGKVGEDTEFTVKTSLASYKLTVAGKIICDIDFVKGIYIIGGKDRMAEHRKNIGLA